jgi:uncharacterized protein YqhQ
MSKEIIGGQALMEGVMMINKKNQGIAVRNPKGKIIIKNGKLNPPSSKITKLPLMRGFINMVYTMRIGYKALNYSSSIATGETEEDMSGLKTFIMLMISLCFAIAIFKFVPLLVTKLIVNQILYLQIANFLPNLIDGTLKISIFILYVYLMSLSKETKRVFEYHGAEHKTVRCQEAKKQLTVKNVKKFSRLHPRCGTAFLFGVFMISILVYTIIPFNSVSFFKNLFFRILLLPLIAGISYEVLKLSGKNEENLFFKIITAPGLWMQKITTKEPDEKQIEVAIAALKAAMKK